MNDTAGRTTQLLTAADGGDLTEVTSRTTSAVVVVSLPLASLSSGKTHLQKGVGARAAEDSSGCRDEVSVECEATNLTILPPPLVSLPAEGCPSENNGLPLTKNTTLTSLQSLTKVQQPSTTTQQSLTTTQQQSSITTQQSLTTTQQQSSSTTQQSLTTTQQQSSSTTQQSLTTSHPTLTAAQHTLTTAQHQQRKAHDLTTTPPPQEQKEHQPPLTPIHRQTPAELQPGPTITLTLHDSPTWEDVMVRVSSALPSSVRGQWYNSHTHLLHCDNPLPLQWRLYIGIMALRRHECPPWALRLLTQSFLECGGEQRWLAWPSLVPPPLQRLLDLNCILAHQPWALTPQFLQRACESGVTQGAVMLCALLLAHHHALAAILLAAPFINLHTHHSTALLKRDLQIGASRDKDKLDKCPADSDDEEEDDTVSLDGFLAGTGTLLSSNNSSPCKPSPLGVAAAASTVPVEGYNNNNNNCGGGGVSDGAQKQHQKIARFGTERSVSSRPSSPVLPPSATAGAAGAGIAVWSPSAAAGTPCTVEDGPPRPTAPLSRSLKDVEGGYKHFPHHLPDEESLCIKANLFRWVDYGFDMTRRLVGEGLTSVLDDRFTASGTLSQCVTVEGRAQPLQARLSGPCHKPVWRQTQWLCGVMHDDYNYRQLRREMPHYLQQLIRTATCFPHKLSYLPRTPLHQSEVLAVLAQAADVRMQCAVLFAVRAFMEYYATRRS